MISCLALRYVDIDLPDCPIQIHIKDNIRALHDIDRDPLRSSDPNEQNPADAQVFGGGLPNGWATSIDRVHDARWGTLSLWWGA